MNLLLALGIFGAVVLILGFRSLRHGEIGEAGVDYPDRRLIVRNEDGDVILRQYMPVAEGGYRDRNLGRPRDNLYYDVPEHCWDLLEKFIDDERDERQHATDYLDGIDDTYRRRTGL